MRFENRKEAGIELAEKLERFKGKDAVVLALPRGGVVVGYEIAKSLNIPLDIIITRKIGHPRSPEYAICAIAEDGHKLCNDKELNNVDKEWFKKECIREQEEAKRRREIYTKDKREKLGGRTAIIVDDGVATGLTLRLAIEEVKHEKPKKIVVAVPVAPRETAEEVSREVDEFVTLEAPAIYLGAVGAYYREFDQVGDEEVERLLKESELYPERSRRVDGLD